MSSASSQPNHLRLVGSKETADDAAWRKAQLAKLAVIKENRLAAHAPGLNPADPRWVLAMQTQARLQGSALTPERREQLLKYGEKLGLRAFEANLVIAIVQDRARVGLTMAGSGPILKLVSEPSTQPAAEKYVAWPQWLAAIAAALGVAGLLIRWLAGG